MTKNLELIREIESVLEHLIKQVELYGSLVDGELAGSVKPDYVTLTQNHYSLLSSSIACLAARVSILQLKLEDVENQLIDYSLGVDDLVKRAVRDYFEPKLDS